jgi:hypothetical protein
VESSDRPKILFAFVDTHGKTVIFLRVPGLFSEADLSLPGDFFG